jgi:hypothetical protein
MTISDISLPRNITIDYCSRISLLLGKKENSFCGLFSIDLNEIYIVPYVPTFGGTHFPYPDLIKVAELNIKPILHQGVDGLPGHEQLASFLKSNVPKLKNSRFLGFSILFSKTKGGFGGTSRSQNNQHFRDYLFDNKDKAFHLYRRQNSYYKSGAFGPPTFFEVTKPGSGVLPKEWINLFKNFLLNEVLYRSEFDIELQGSQDSSKKNIT